MSILSSASIFRNFCCKSRSFQRVESQIKPKKILKISPTLLPLAKQSLLTTNGVFGIFAFRGILESYQSHNKQYLMKVDDWKIHFNSKSLVLQGPDKLTKDHLITDKDIQKFLFNITSLNLFTTVLWITEDRDDIQMKKYFIYSPFLSNTSSASIFLSLFLHPTFSSLYVNMCLLMMSGCLWNASQPYTYFGEKFHKPIDTFCLYISSGLISNLLTFACQCLTKSHTDLYGASGAIMGLIGYFLTKYPDKEIQLDEDIVLKYRQLFISFLIIQSLLALMIFVISNSIFTNHLFGFLFGCWFALYGEDIFRLFSNFFCDKWNKINGSTPKENLLTKATDVLMNNFHL